MTLCKVCGTWARDAADTLPEHHEQCPLKGHTHLPTEDLMRLAIRGRGCHPRLVAMIFSLQAEVERLKGERITSACGNSAQPPLGDAAERVLREYREQEGL
jgi:hypothetical protein